MPDMTGFIKAFYRQRITRSFLTKNILVYTAICLIPVVILSVLVSTVGANILLQKEIRQNNLLLYNLNQYVDGKHELVYRIVRQAYSDIVTIPEVFAFLETDLDETSMQHFDYSRKFYGYFSLFFGSDKDLRHVVLYKKVNDTVYIVSREGNRTMAPDEISDRAFLDKINALAPSASIEPVHRPAYDPDSNVYSLFINIKVLGTNRNSSVLKLDFDPAGFTRAVAQMDSQLQGTIYVLTPAGDVLYDSTGASYGQPFREMGLLEETQGTAMIDGEEVVITASRDNDFGLVIASVIPKTSVMREINRLRGWIYLIAAICFLIAVLFVRISAALFTRRIHQITSVMSEIRNGDLNARVAPMPQADEIAGIATDLNRMSDDLQRHINRVYVAEIKQKNAEIGALQAQINPHFLYNTLEAIRMTAISNGDREVGRMVFLLSGLFRRMVKEETCVTVASELEHVRAYLELFKLRYGDKLVYELQVPETLLDMGIVKHLIQPVVENYIMHGFDILRTDNRIAVRCTLQDAFIHISVEDNGRGMAPDRLEEIRRSMETEEDARTGIGLRNVDQRIRLVYGPPCRLDIESIENQCTTVTLTIAAMTLKELKQHVQRTDRG